jgi:hypothetical protein
MVWDGTLAIEITGKNSAVLTYTGFDADNEESYTLSPVKPVDLGFTPTHAKLISTNAQAGLTYDIQFQGSIDGTNWTQILQNTAKDTLATTSIDYTSATGDPIPAAYPFYRVEAPDVTDGAATTHTVTVYLYGDGVV